jgi:tetratricopeptide (TPR) repeat protein
VHPSTSYSSQLPLLKNNTESVRRYLYGIFFFVAVVVMPFLCPAFGMAEEKELTDDQARQQCFKGKAIYCLALGIKEEKAGHQERALELYRTACKKHPTPGHLRACTPLLELAWKMNRLDEESVPLETRCQEDDPITCFYLGQEYLKLVEMEKAFRHLEPLCRSHFRPPDSANYGPCYHLAKGYEQAAQWNRAMELFQFDCENHAEKGQPSCVAMKELVEMERVHRQVRQKRIRSFDPVEAVLLFVVFMSVLNVWIWFKGGKWGLKYLVWVAPAMVWGSAITWVYWPEKPEYPLSQWVVLFFASLLVTGMAVFAYRALYPSNISR